MEQADGITASGKAEDESVTGFDHMSFSYGFSDFSKHIVFFQERLGVLDATCAARKRLPLRTSAIRRRL